MKRFKKGYKKQKRKGEKVFWTRKEILSTSFLEKCQRKTLQM